MKKTILIAFLVLPVLAMLGYAASTYTSPNAPDTELASLAKYRQWTLVNPTRQLMESAAAAACAPAFPQTQGSPHLHKYISVFVNPIGRDQMMTKTSPKYPVGSMIVKEKFGTADSTTPELLTAMIKREAGYNPDGGDWEYLVLDGSASEIVEQGKLTRCSSCHQPYQSIDYVTRTYLPQKVRRELKP
jgi:cytochrome P460